MRPLTCPQAHAALLLLLRGRLVTASVFKGRQDIWRPKLRHLMSDGWGWSCPEQQPSLRGL